MRSIRAILELYLINKLERPMASTKSSTFWNSTISHSIPEWNSLSASTTEAVSLRAEVHCHFLHPSVCLSLPVWPSLITREIFFTDVVLTLSIQILWANISDNLDDRYRSSLNMHIIYQKVTLTFCAFLKHLTQVDIYKVNISTGLYGTPIFVFLTIFFLKCCLNEYAVL